MTASLAAGLAALDCYEVRKPNADSSSSCEPRLRPWAQPSLEFELETKASPSSKRAKSIPLRFLYE